MGAEEAAHKETWLMKEAVGFEHNTAEEVGPCGEIKTSHRCQHIYWLQEKTYRLLCTNVLQRCEWNQEVVESFVRQYHTKTTIIKFRPNDSSVDSKHSGPV